MQAIEPIESFAFNITTNSRIFTPPLPGQPIGQCDASTIDRFYYEVFTISFPTTGVREIITSFSGDVFFSVILYSNDFDSHNYCENFERYLYHSVSTACMYFN